jgi:hypothetical protein
LYVLALPVVDLFKQRDNRSLFLFFWVMGTFVFASQTNWTVNARSLVPMAPAIGILIARRIDVRYAEKPFSTKWVAACLLPAFALTLTLAYADYTLARAGKTAASQYRDLVDDYDHVLRFTGHWGFQFYMLEQEFPPLEYINTEIAKGDVLVIPANNTGLHLMDADTPNEFTLDIPVFPFATTWSNERRAGFYSNNWGSLPYIFGSALPERYNAVIFEKDALISVERTENDEE